MASLKRGTKWYFIGGLLALELTISWFACVPSSAPAPTSTVVSSPTPTVTPTTLPTTTMTPKPVTTTPPMPTSTPAQTEPKEMIKSSIGGQGIAIFKDDTGLPDWVMEKGEVLFIPEEHAEDLAEAANLDPADINRAWRGWFQLDEFQLAELAGTAAVIGADGRFPIDVPAGPYFICIADIYIGHTAGPPYTILACDVIELPNDASLTVSWGKRGSWSIVWVIIPA